MTIGASSVRTAAEFRHYFPNASHSSPLDYLKPEPLDNYRLILIIAFSSLLVVGISANAWVARVVGIVLRQTRTEAPRAVQIFILALCACDVFVLAFLGFLLSDLWYGQWVVPSSFLCQSYLISESLSKFYAPFLLVELSGFCYLSVKHRRQAPTPFASSAQTPRSGRATKGAVVAVVLALALAFVFMAPVYIYSDVVYLVLYNGSEVMNVLAKCAFQPPDYVMTTFAVYSFIFGYLVPACLFTIFYGALLVYVHRRRRKSSCPTVKSMDYFSKVARTTLGLVLFYFASWTPFWSMVVWQYFAPEANQMSDAAVILSYFIHMLPYINCNAYPLLYTILNRSIQHDYSRACEQTRSQRLRRKESESVSGVRSSFRTSASSRASFRVNDSNANALLMPVLSMDQAVIRRSATVGRRTNSVGHQSKSSMNLLQPPNSDTMHNLSNHRRSKSVRGLSARNSVRVEETSKLL